MEEGKEKENHDNKRKQPDPIIDGDARPDMIVGDDPLKVLKEQAHKNQTEDFTENRAVDNNTLEDYKDKK